MYDYRESITADILEYIRTEGNPDEIRQKLGELGGREDLETELYDELWTEDSVTGNACGSYTVDRWKACEYVAENMDILAEAVAEYGIDADTIADHFINEGWEYFDITIRCYLLGECISAALNEIEWEATR